MFVRKVQRFYTCENQIILREKFTCLNGKSTSRADDPITPVVQHIASVLLFTRMSDIPPLAAAIYHKDTYQ